MTPPTPHDETVTVYSFSYFDLATRDTQVALYKATRAVIEATQGARVLEGTAEVVTRDALDAQGRYRRMATGWGDLR